MSEIEQQILTEPIEPPLEQDAPQRQAQALRHFHLLSGTIYHLKNTLAVASEYNELLEMDGKLSDQHREYVTRSRRSIGVALRLLSELHELGRADSGELVPVSEPLHLNTLLRDMLSDYHLANATTGVHYVIESTPIPGIETDVDCVRNILDMLLSNAARYSPRDGVITIRTKLQPGRRASDPPSWLRIDVIDQGPGVAEKEAVFEEVQRVNRKGPPGFRLAIGRRLARLLGGDLTLQTSDAGSMFSLWLPLTP
jgi:signal transduction histidine kinase